MKNRIVILYLFIFILSTFITFSSEPDYCRVRLSNKINGYQPTLVPVITVDGEYLYIDRAGHPENTGSINDIDEIWVSKRIRKCDFSHDEENPTLINHKIQKLLMTGNVRDLHFGSFFSKSNDTVSTDTIFDNLFNQIIENGEWTEPVNAGSPLNTKFSDVLFSISPDGNKALVYGLYDNNLSKKTGGFSIAHKILGKWDTPKPLKIKNYYNNKRRRAQNYYGNLSADGRILLLAVNRFDSRGNLDLYVSFREDDSDIWTEPLNLGDKINTAGDEASPFLAYDGKSLYFASEGHEGFGKLDLFVSRRLDNSWTNWSKPVNLGRNINSIYDEQSIYLSALGDTAYIVSFDTISSRPGVYYACLPKNMQPYPYAIIQGSIFGLENDDIRKIYEHVNFTIDYKDNELSETYYTDLKNGRYCFVLSPDTVHTILVEKSRYNPNYTRIDTRGLQAPAFFTKDLILRPLVDTIGILITKVNYETDVDSLSFEACEIISNFIAGIKHPNRRKYLIVGHADDNGSDLYNLQLSKRRAKIAYEYLVELGVKKENIRYEWRGEVQPRSNDDSENRRVEIYVE